MRALTSEPVPRNGHWSAGCILHGKWCQPPGHL